MSRGDDVLRVTHGRRELAPADVRRVEYARGDDGDDDNGDEDVGVQTDSVTHHRQLRPVKPGRRQSCPLCRLHVHVRQTSQDVSLYALVLGRVRHVWPIAEGPLVGVVLYYRRTFCFSPADDVHAEQ